MQNTTLLKADFGTPEWHEIRRSGIGGSDAAAVLGMSKFKSPYQLFLEKTGDADQIPDNWDMQRGRALEPVIRQNYSDRTGRVVRLLDGVLRDNDRPFMLGNFDGLTEDNRLVEIKAPRYTKEWGEAGTDQIPQEYLIQVQHYLAITRFEIADVVVSFGGGAPLFYEVPADNDLQEMIIEGERKFWDMVQSNTPPDPTTAEDVAKMFKRSTAGSVIATPEIEAELAALKITRNELDMLEEKKQVHETALKIFMGEKDTICDAFGIPLVTWKESKPRETFDTKAFKQDKPELYDEYVKIGDSSRRFLLK